MYLYIKYCFFVSEVVGDRWKVYQGGWQHGPRTKRLRVEVESLSKQRQTDIGRMGGTGYEVALQIPLLLSPPLYTRHTHVHHSNNCRSTNKYSEVPQSTNKYREVPHSTGGSGDEGRLANTISPSLLSPVLPLHYLSTTPCKYHCSILWTFKTGPTRRA